jgi:hypothetical protein
VTLVWAYKLAIGEHYRIENDSEPTSLVEENNLGHYAHATT